MIDCPKLVLGTALSALLSLSLASCERSAEQAAVQTGNSLLAYVPEDSPYLAGNLEPIPEDVIETIFERVQPALDAMQAALADTKIKVSGSGAEENPGLALLGAVLEELDGKLSREGIESMGFTMQAHQAAYGMGAFPVFRLSLGSAEALRETIGRLEASSGVEFPRQEYQGQPYWQLADEGGNAPVGIYIAIIEEASGAHLAIGVLPQTVESELLPAFLGQVKPENSSAALRLAELNAEYGYTPYGTGFLDFQRLFDRFTDPSSKLRKVLENSGVRTANMSLNEVCQAEIRGMIARAPRMVAGATEMTPSAMAGQYRLELADDLAGELAELVSDVPAAPQESDRLLEFAFGIRIGAARDFLIRKFTALSQKTFECEALKDINGQASKALTQLNTPMPPLVNNFLGLRASLDGVPGENMDFSAFLGTVAVHVDKPEMFLGMAKMFLPQLAEFQLAKNEPPKPVPQSLIPVPNVVAHAAMSDTALGIAVGQGEEARLLAYLQAESEGTGAFLSANYDTAAYMERIDELTEGMKGAGVTDDSIVKGEFEGASGDTDARGAQATEVEQAFREAFRNMVGRSHIEFRFDEHGFAIDSRMLFKD